MEIIEKYDQIIVVFNNKEDLVNNLSKANKRLSWMILHDEFGGDDDY